MFPMYGTTLEVCWCLYDADATSNDGPTAQTSFTATSPFTGSLCQSPTMEILPQTGFRFHVDGTSMVILVQTPTSPSPRSHPGPWSPSEIWMILLLPMLIVAFMGLVFVRSSRSQIKRMRK